MTATTERPTCPAWCTLGLRCRGDHAGEFLGVSATVDEQTDGIYPTVTVWPNESPSEGYPVCIVLHLGLDVDGPVHMDSDVHMRPDEARQLIGNLQLILGQIGGSA